MILWEPSGDSPQHERFLQGLTLVWDSQRSRLVDPAEWRSATFCTFRQVSPPQFVGSWHRTSKYAWVQRDKVKQRKSLDWLFLGKRFEDEEIQFGSSGRQDSYWDTCDQSTELLSQEHPHLSRQGDIFGKLPMEEWPAKAAQSVRIGNSGGGGSRAGLSYQAFLRDMCFR